MRGKINLNTYLTPKCKILFKMDHELLVQNFRKLLLLQSKERWEKEADHCRLVGGRLNKQEKLHMKLVLSGHKMNRSLYLPVKILKVDIEALTRFSHIYHPGGLNSTLLFEGWILKNGSGYNNNGQRIHSKDQGSGEKPLIGQNNCIY